MITVIKNDNHVYGVTPSEIFGKSTDTKPTDVNNASTFYEIDTKKVFMFDEETKQWIEQ